MPYAPPMIERRERVVGASEVALYFGTGIAVGWLLGGPVGAVLGGIATAAFSAGFITAETRHLRHWHERPQGAAAWKQ